ncbi:alpha-hydroxy acid oxidase [Shewanella khirikhana]|uniref:L-lactate dehydrogenase [cytochrome] n=1 Tax=Shewanella khirikhana TaxID=1965282 RepID=A0ABM7DQG3_9GAMM|nr:alpha-hydroxy acid oxidase [Shewanella khirikhana]AZQ11928.1 L-lactate dehydrogenase [cytochrome] [Shewanella khirikhana]
MVQASTVDNMNASTARVATQPSGPIFSLADYEKASRHMIDEGVWHYIHGGAGDGITLARNRSAFDDIRLMPRVLAAGLPDMRCSLLESTLAAPILLAPLALQKLVHRDGELASVAAAMAQDCGFVLSTLTSSPMATVAHSAASASTKGATTPLWFQLYIQPDWQDTLSLIRRAEDLGFGALVITVDAPITGLRLAELRAGFSVPEHIQPVELAGMKAAPTSLEDLLAAAPGWHSIEAVCAATRLPVMLKGVLSPEDALKAKALGIAGVIVSNHGGRVLDGVPGTIECLPAVRAAVGPEMTVLLDGGVRRGSDIAKALCLGADAVLIGRPLMQALACEGALGVARMLKILKDELAMVMALLGAKRIKDLNRHCLWKQSCC